MDDRLDRGFTPLPDGTVEVPDVADEVEQGELTGDEAAEQVQQAARRRTAEEGPALDTNEDGTITQGGFGSGRGMGGPRGNE